MVAPAEKASLQGCQFDSKQCREQSVTHLFCFPSLDVIIWPSECLSSYWCLLLDHDTYGGVDPLGVFPLFLKKVADIIAQTKHDFS